MAFWSWSKAPAGNATADPTINWAEGQSPSSVNDSARAMMARVAEWRDDVSGGITSGNTSTAYTLTSNQGFDTLAHMHRCPDGGCDRERRWAQRCSRRSCSPVAPRPV